MSKKKKKLDKKLIAERLRELEAEAQEGKDPLPVKSVKKEAAKTLHKKTMVSEPREKKLNDADEIIVKDVKKVAILTTVIIVIFVALYLVNLKTNYILKASDKIFNVLHIGQS
jgi:hypothetical protein